MEKERDGARMFEAVKTLGRETRSGPPRIVVGGVEVAQDEGVLQLRQ